MKCYQRDNSLKTYVGKKNSLRDQTEEQLLLLGLSIGMRLSLLAANEVHNIANQRLKAIYDKANEFWLVEMQKDPELYAEIMHSRLDKLMGEGWEK